MSVATSVALVVTALLVFTALAAGARLPQRPSGLSQRASVQRALVAGSPQILRDRVSITSGAIGGGSFQASAHAAKALNVADPIAHAAGINTVVPAFHLDFFFYQSSFFQQNLKLAYLQITHLHAGALVFGGCGPCPGKGSFKPARVRRGTFKAVARGTLLVTPKTRIVEAVFHTDEIGRYGLYGVKRSGIRPKLQLLKQGCIAADGLFVNNISTRVELFDLLHPGSRTLPLVPCNAPAPRDAVTGFSVPTELSPTAPLPGTISVRTSGPRWVTIYQVHGLCKFTPLAESTATNNHTFSIGRVPGGPFTLHFTVAPDTAPGNFCVYIQTGGKFANVPDGRVTFGAPAPYFAGDAIGVSGPSATAGPNQKITDTFAGRASVPEQLWVFDAYSPCAATAQAEYTPSVGLIDIPLKAGAFTENVTSVPLAQSAFRCAYLQVGPPSAAKKPTGPTVASTSLAISVP